MDIDHVASAARKAGATDATGWPWLANRQSHDEMTDYASMTVAQLKDVLKERELPTQGLKAALVERLQQADATAAEPTDATTRPAAEEHTPEAAEPAATPAEAEAPVAEQRAAAEPRTLSPEEMKQAAVAHLSKKLHRARKFGEDDAAVGALQKQLARLEKFGLDLTTQLAQELGFGRGPAAAVGKHAFHRRRGYHQGKKFKAQRR
ncbi:ADL069Wp [Eremothecium gossypii ATCC 10895]|uniref:ADL069Wp n=1 Tax=Eremothecium gossypii (strain ATCC 10895 / CBS 109.51 / FGSC 9923 / NRRL Y-1056) TaxID=284811 RepID=Q75AJ6_EREGS|nr:ADL069Wp [Eremothecium gossypii ATCC 10895]AAS51851.1 ADL069Wp [Eremothecium gossypii ATCC 10895]AEY96148.1 FADL069Wp [Eremothecium gossypii FDAG1]